MRSLFLRIFLWFCAGSLLLAAVIVGALLFTTPDALSTAWRRVGRGAVVSAARVAAETYESSGSSGLSIYMQKLAADTGLHPQLFDSSGRDLNGSPSPDMVRDLASLSSPPQDRLTLLAPPDTAAVRVRGPSGSLYSFLTTLPRRTDRIVWSPRLILSFVLFGCLVCYLLARSLTAPMVRLRALTSRFSGGDLATRVTEASLLRRRDEIGGMARDFNDMAMRIETLMRGQKRLLADVSHELRSPLTRMRLSVGLLRRSVGAEGSTSVSRIERDIERLDSLIQQLLVLSRLECAATPPPMEKLDLAQIVTEIVADAAFEAQSMNRGVRLVECCPSVVLGEQRFLHGAVENVIRNAVRYTKPETEVQVRLFRPEGAGRAVITVVDSGPGVLESELTHIFEPFYRVGEARERESGGVGLGLAITRQVVNLHGGSVQAFNQPGGGLEVQIALTLADAA
ncbi:MAG: HAMP domain-containing protein [Bryobacterales bacterium]|nr:HAMP domain-containing protein [Bryobacterales bacterium]MBV9400727.1 HAMP domain-containing protein [Bryobacterales bacterium]